VRHAEVVVRQVRKKQWHADDHRDWPAGGPSLEECVKRVQECDAVVVLVAHRYGSLPELKGRKIDERSFVWHEVEGGARERHSSACVPRRRGRTVAAQAGRSAHQFAGGRAARALQGSLKKFVCGKFAAPVSLEGPVFEALTKLERDLRSPPKRGAHETKRRSPDVLARYVKFVESDLRNVELLGFGAQFQAALPIDELYVPLRLRLGLSFRNELGEGPGNHEKRSQRAVEVARDDVAIEHVFREAADRGLRGVVLLGDPGSGKTTAAKRLCWRCADKLLGPEELGLPASTVPVFLPCRRITRETLEGTLFDALADYFRARKLDDSDEVVAALKECGSVLWALDGLDEVADRKLREKVSRWIRESSKARPDDHFVVTCRYAGWQGEVVLGPRFLSFDVRNLEIEQQAEFVRRWYRTVETHMHKPGPRPIRWRASARGA
jgi:hypothetical protein